MIYSIEQLMELPAGTKIFTWDRYGICAKIFLSATRNERRNGYWIAYISGGIFIKGDVTKMASTYQGALSGYTADIQNAREHQLEAAKRCLESALKDMELPIGEPEYREDTTLYQPLEHYIALDIAQQLRQGRLQK